MNLKNSKRSGNDQEKNMKKKPLYLLLVAIVCGLVSNLVLGCADDQSAFLDWIDMQYLEQRDKKKTDGFSFDQIYIVFAVEFGLMEKAKQLVTLNPGLMDHILSEIGQISYRSRLPDGLSDFLEFLFDLSKEKNQRESISHDLFTIAVRQKENEQAEKWFDVIKKELPIAEGNPITWLGYIEKFLVGFEEIGNHEFVARIEKESLDLINKVDDKNKFDIMLSLSSYYMHSGKVDRIEPLVSKMIQLQYCINEYTLISIVDWLWGYWLDVENPQLCCNLTDFVIRLIKTMNSNENKYQIEEKTLNEIEQALFDKTFDYSESQKESQENEKKMNELIIQGDYLQAKSIAHKSGYLSYIYYKMIQKKVFSSLGVTPFSSLFLTNRIENPQERFMALFGLADLILGREIERFNGSPNVGERIEEIVSAIEKVITQDRKLLQDVTIVEHMFALYCMFKMGDKAFSIIKENTWLEEMFQLKAFMELTDLALQDYEFVFLDKMLLWVQQKKTPLYFSIATRMLSKVAAASWLSGKRKNAVDQFKKAIEISVANKNLELSEVFKDVLWALKYNKRRTNFSIFHWSAHLNLEVR
jgi:hypothetical protein